MDRVWATPLSEQIINGYTKTSVDEADPTVQPKPLLDFGEVQKQSIHIGSLCECSAVVEVVHEDLPFTTPELHDEIWNGERASAWVEHFFAAPQELSPYFIAEASEIQHRIDTGLPMNAMRTSDRLTTIATLPGINTPYVYISTGLSCGFLHKEDMNLLSANVLRKGHPKIWIIVPARETDKLEACIADSLSLVYTCDQFIRHANLMISPRQLDLWKVKYSLVVQNVGDLIVTDYNAYHQVLNTGPNMAEAINGCEAEWQPPFSYSACHKRCNNQSGQISRALFLAVEPPEPARPAESHARKNLRTNLKAPKYAFGQASAKSRKPVVVPKLAPLTINDKLFGAQGKGEPGSWGTTSKDSLDGSDEDCGNGTSSESSEVSAEESGSDALDSDQSSAACSSSGGHSLEKPPAPDASRGEKGRVTSKLETSSSGTGEDSQPGASIEVTSRLLQLRCLVDEAVTLGQIILPTAHPQTLRTTFERYLPGDSTNSWLNDEAIMATMRLLTASSSRYLVVDCFLYENFNQRWAKGLEAEHVFLPRCYKYHWELIHIETQAKVITLFGNAESHFEQWAEQIKVVIDPNAEWEIRSKQPAFTQLNTYDCALFLFAQAEVTMNEDIRPLIPAQDSLELRYFYLNKLVEWARLENRGASYLTPVLKRYPSLSTDSPAKRHKLSLPIHFSPESEIMTTFGSPEVFANICILRQSQLYSGPKPRDLICAALDLVTRSESSQLQSSWHIRLAEAIVLQQFEVCVKDAKEAINKERRQRERARTHGEHIGAPQVTRAKARAYDEMLKIWGATDNQRKTLEDHIKQAKKLGHLFALTGDGFSAPFWMLAPPHEYQTFSKFSYTSRVAFLSDLKAKRPRLMERHNTICAGLRIVLGLEEGSLKIDEMDPTTLANELQDSDMLMSCLDRSP